MFDGNGRVLDYTFDSLSRQTTEKWYNNLTDADVPQNVQKTYTTTYDESGRIASIGDGDYDFDYTYSIFGNLTSTTQDLTGLTDDVEFSYGYDVLGRKTSVSAAVGSTDDYVNGYSYDALGRITQITQDGVTGGNAVAEKRVDFGYSDDGTRATISRFADLAGTKAVAETEKVFDELGRVTDIVHERAATDFADYDLTWDAAGRISDFDFDSLVGDDGDAAYSYDDTNQLTASDYASDWQTDESCTYDDNGNRTNTGYSTGDHNRLTSDGTYNYTYDNEGNVLTKTNISDSTSVEYIWDHRNRLTKVTFKNSGGTATEIIEYAYDHGQRWVRKTLDTSADGTIESSQVFVHDNGQIVLDFQKTGTTAASNSDLANRYLWGKSVDSLLTSEAVDDGTGDDIAWTLADHLGSVRDLAVYDPITEAVSVAKHVTYDAFGNVTSDSATAVKSLFLYTARPLDADTGLQNNLNRWYDLSMGRWMSVDPIGFDAGDVNLYRYVGNSPALAADPLGLEELAHYDAAVEIFGAEYTGTRERVVTNGNPYNPALHTYRETYIERWYVYHRVQFDAGVLNVNGRCVPYITNWRPHPPSVYFFGTKTVEWEHPGSLGVPAKTTTKYGLGSRRWSTLVIASTRPYRVNSIPGELQIDMTSEFAAYPVEWSTLRYTGKLTASIKWGIASISTGLTVKPPQMFGPESLDLSARYSTTAKVKVRCINGKPDIDVNSLIRLFDFH